MSESEKKRFLLILVKTRSGAAVYFDAQNPNDLYFLRNWMVDGVGDALSVNHRTIRCRSNNITCLRLFCSEYELCSYWRGLGFDRTADIRTYEENCFDSLDQLKEVLKALAAQHIEAEVASRKLVNEVMDRR